MQARVLSMVGGYRVHAFHAAGARASNEWETMQDGSHYMVYHLRSRRVSPRSLRGIRSGVAAVPAQPADAALVALLAELTARRSRVCALFDTTSPSA